MKNFAGILLVMGIGLPPQTLPPGGSTVLNVAYEIGNVAVTNPQVVDYLVQEDRHQIYLNAKQAGFATITLWDAAGGERDIVPVSVRVSVTGGLAASAKEMFADQQGIQVETAGDALVLHGEADTPLDLERVRRFASQHPSVVNQVELTGSELERLMEKIRSALATPGIEVAVVRNQLVLQGIAYSAQQAKRAYDIAKIYDPTILNLIEVRETGRRPGRTPMVRLNVYLIELQKSALRSFGIQWSPGAFPQSGGGAAGATASLGGGGGISRSVGGLGESLLGFVLNLLPKIRWINEHGLGRVLENPSLIVKSGDPAQFFSGMQVPYYSQQTIEFKEVGVRLEAEPVVSGNDIDLKITTTLSSLAPDIRGGINTHKVATTAYLRSGESMVLGGLVSRRDAKVYHRVPKDLALGSALWTLFLSKDFQKGETEFVVFVSPEIVTEAPPATAQWEQWQQLEKEVAVDVKRKPRPAVGRRVRRHR